MKAVVLIGGQGTRLRPITSTVLKALVPLRNKPYVHYLIEALAAAGIEGAILSMGYLPDPIQRYFAEEEPGDFSVEYIVEDRPLGTAGGIKNAERSLGDGPFVATNGDVLTGVNLEDIVGAHSESGALATIMLTSVEDPTSYGLVEVDHELWVRRFVEKPGIDDVHTSLVNAGVYVLERRVLDMIPPGKEVSIEREIFPRLQAMGKLRAYVSSAYWRDIGTPRSYLAASHDVLSGAVGRDAGFRYTCVHPSASISKHVTLLPPISVAEGCRLGAGATVGGRTAMGRGCLIGEGATVEGSVLFAGAEVGDGSVVRNSIIGPGAVIRNDCVVRGLSVLGAGCVVESGNVLDRGARVSPLARIRGGALSF